MSVTDVRVSPERTIEAMQIIAWAAITVLAYRFHLSPTETLVVGILFIVRRVFWPRYSRKGDMLIAASIPAAAFMVGAALTAIAHTHSKLIDAQLSKLDLGIGVAIWEFAKGHSWFGNPLQLVYSSLPYAMLLGLFIAQERMNRLFVSFLLGAFVAAPCYFMFPAVGPAHVGDMKAPPNCMPSMHMAWALLLWMNAKGWSKTIFGVFALLTAVSTMSTGEHYLTDLVVAVPFAILLDKLAKKMLRLK